MPDQSEKNQEAQKDSTQSAQTQSQKPAYIVGIGASAGGLEALELFFKNMPPDADMAFVVVQHLSPDYKSLMVELLSKHTQMKVFRAEDSLKVKPNCVYLIPPKKNLTIFHDTLYLEEQNVESGINLPIDIFLRSLAEDRGEQAIGVILSGTGSDGMRGVREIKGAGGMVMVQDTNSAKFDGMPRSAISTGLADFILPAEEMPEQIISFVQHPYVSAKKKEEHGGLVSEEEKLAKVAALLQKHTGVDFTYYKPNTVIRRIERRMSINQIESLDDYLKYIYQSPREIHTLYKELLIGVTKFFRDTEVFQYIQDRVIPDIFDGRSSDNPVRVWVTGCSTGEEAYSLAICFQEYIEREQITVPVKIFATDIDRDSVEFAGAGVYPESIAADISDNRLLRFFVKQGESYQISRPIREMVVFATQNLIKDPPFTKIDMISCRNLLIYLQPILQKKVLSYFHFSLNPSGILVLGTSETVGDMTEQFNHFSSKHKIYQNRTRKLSSIANTLAMTNLSDRYERQRAHNLQNRHAHRETNMEYVYQNIIEDYVPPCIVVDENNELVHVFGDVNKFLKIPTGRISYNVLKLAPKDLSVAMATAIHKALRDNKEVVYSRVRLTDTQKRDVVFNLRVKPGIERRDAPRLINIFFEKPHELEQPSSPEDIETFDMDNQARQRILDLESELQYTRENLQATIEELETSNEELQATNEELLAANEELQSTNEELQSVNEELYTVNAEYQSKIEELTELNNDMDNLLASTTNGTIFLDRNLAIRKITPSISDVINVSQSDIGRPLEHFSHNFQHKDLIKDVRQVLQTLMPIEREVQTLDNHWYLLRILPYRVDEHIVKGVVLTLINISDLKKVHLEKNLLHTAIEHSPTIVAVTDYDANLKYVNNAFEKATGYTADEVLGQNTNILKSDEMEEEVYKNLWKTIKHGDKWSGRFINRRKDGSLFHEEAVVFPILDGEERIVQFMKVAEDITERVLQEAELRKRTDYLAKLERNAHVGHFEFNRETKEVEWSDEAYRLYGVRRDSFEPSFENIMGLIHPDDRDKAVQAVSNALEKDEPFILEYRVLHSDNTVKNLRLHGWLGKDEEGNVAKISGTVQDLNWLGKIENAMRDQLVIVVDTNGQITHINQKAGQTLGIQENEAIGADWFDRFVPESELKKTRRIFKDILEGEIETYRNRQGNLLTNDGEELSALWQYGIFKDDEGGITAVIMIGEVH